MKWLTAFSCYAVDAILVKPKGRLDINVEDKSHLVYDTKYSSKTAAARTAARADARTTTEVLICVSADSRDAVDDVVGKAGAAGGRADPSPKQDYGFMYGRSFEDPDGHIWEVMWMDVEAASKAHAAPVHA